MYTLYRNLIGAEQKWEETNDQVYDNFASTGDWMLNSAPDLAAVIDAGVSHVQITCLLSV